MVDVGAKQESVRLARAQSCITMSQEAFRLLKEEGHKKGDVLQVARIAGIQATKRTSDLIPLCHPLALTHVSVEFELDDDACMVRVITSAKLTGRTGVEMEALTGATVAALTIFDMCKAIDPKMQISDTKVLEKVGGKSGHFVCE